MKRYEQNMHKFRTNMDGIDKNGKANTNGFGKVQLNN